MEKIKFGTVEYELPVNGAQLTDQGGKVIFMPGAASFADIEEDVKAAKSITVLDAAGEPILTRTDLVYAGRLTKDDNYVIGAYAEQGTDITGTVMIAEFRQPDLADKVAALEAKLEYVAMMTDVQMEV